MIIALSQFPGGLVERARYWSYWGSVITQAMKGWLMIHSAMPS